MRSLIPTLILDAVDAAGNDVSAVKVTVDGEPLLSHIDGTAVSVDPGPHVFTFSVVGQPAEQRMLVMGEAVKDRRVRIEIAPPPPEPSHVGRTQRILGLAFGGTGVISMAIATGFGLVARSNLDKSHVDCGPTTCANEPRAASELQTATNQATISTGGFIAGGAFLVAGGMLFLTAPSAQRAATSALSLAPGLAPGGASLQLHGTF